MIQDRVREILDFTQSESPYRKANKGWINQDIFLDLSPSSETLKQKKEVAKVTILWTPINSFLSKIFLILIFSSLLVLTSLSFVKGRFDFNFLNTSLINYQVEVEENTVASSINTEISDSSNSLLERDLVKIEFDDISSIDDKKINSDEKIRTNETEIQETRTKEIESNKNIKVIENKKTKSNFI